MATKTTTANLVLGHLGIGSEIANLDTENSAEAVHLRRFYDEALEITPRDYPWSFAKAYVALGSKTIGTEVTDWEYSYTYPSDCVFIRKIYSGNRQDSLQTQVPYDVAYDGQSRVIHTDLQNACVSYTKRVTNYNYFPADFVMALSFRWALYMPNTMLAGDPFKLKQDIFQQYLIEIGNARRNDSSEQKSDIPLDSEFIRGRG